MRASEHPSSIYFSASEEDDLDNIATLSKGKSIDPQNWRNLDIPDSEMNPETQRAILCSVQCTSVPGRPFNKAEALAWKRKFQAAKQKGVDY